MDIDDSYNDKGHNYDPDPTRSFEPGTTGLISAAWPGKRPPWGERYDIGV